MRKICAYVLVVILLIVYLTGIVSAEDADLSALLGIQNGEMYENELIGLGCRLDGWDFCTEDDLRLESIGMAGLEWDDWDHLLENGYKVYVMLAFGDSGSFIRISIRDIGQLLSAYENTGTDKDLLIVSEGMREAALNESSQIQKTEINIGNQKCFAVKTAFDSGDDTAYILQAYFIRDHYLVCVSFNSLSSDVTDDLAASFYSIQE